jgi:hypothetical protein
MPPHENDQADIGANMEGYARIKPIFTDKEPKLFDITPLRRNRRGINTMALPAHDFGPPLINEEGPNIRQANLACLTCRKVYISEQEKSIYIKQGTSVRGERSILKEELFFQDVPVGSPRSLRKCMCCHVREKSRGASRDAAIQTRKGNKIGHGLNLLGVAPCLDLLILEQPCKKAEAKEPCKKAEAKVDTESEDRRQSLLSELFLDKEAAVRQRREAPCFS